MKYILTYLKQKKADRALIQEPLVNDEEAAKRKKYCVAQEFHSTISLRKRGVSIFLRKTQAAILIWLTQGRQMDYNGCYFTTIK